MKKIRFRSSIFSMKKMRNDIHLFQILRNILKRDDSYVGKRRCLIPIKRHINTTFDSTYESAWHNLADNKSYSQTYFESP